MEGFEISAGKQKLRQGDTGVRGSLALQFVGVSTNKSGAMVTKIKLNPFKYEAVQENDPDSGIAMPVVYQRAREIDAQETDNGAYKNDKGKWVVRLERKRLEPDYPEATDVETRYKGIMDTEVYFQCKVIWPETHHGQIVPCSAPIDGIEFPHGPDRMGINFITEGQYVKKMMKLAVAFGFQPEAMDPDMPIYDPAYIQPYAQDLELPLTKAQVVERFLVPLLVRHGVQGHLAMAETSDNSHFIIASTVKPMSEAAAKKTLAEAATWEAKDQEPTEEGKAPFFDEEPEAAAETPTEPGKMKTGPEAEQLRAKVRELAVGKDRFAWDLSEFLDTQGIAYQDESLLASLDVDGLKKVVAHFTPKEPKTPTL